MKFTDNTIKTTELITYQHNKSRVPIYIYLYENIMSKYKQGEAEKIDQLA